jgi:hypothetical protein
MGYEVIIKASLLTAFVIGGMFILDYMDKHPDKPKDEE